MHKLTCLALVLAACASTLRGGIVDRTVLERVSIGDAREAAQAVLGEIADPSVVRVSDEGSVVTAGRFGRCDEDVACASNPGRGGGGGTGSPIGVPWATIEVRLLDLGTNTEVEVDIEYELRLACSRSNLATCQPEPLASNGGLERRILEGIRARLVAARG